MNALRYRFGTAVTSFGCLALLALLCGCGSKADFDKARWAKWKGTEAGISNLDASIDILGVKIRPPKNFEALPVADGPEGSKITAWKQQRSDGTVRAVQLMVIPVAEEMNSPTPAEALKTSSLPFVRAEEVDSTKRLLQWAS